MIPTIEWHENTVRMIDQRKLPAKVEWYVCRGYGDAIEAIRKMVIRGAPAIGIAAAMGLSLGANTIRSRDKKKFMQRFETICADMRRARPTAVNLGWAVDRMKALADRHDRFLHC